MAITGKPTIPSPIYTEDGYAFRAAVVGASHHAAAATRTDKWGFGTTQEKTRGAPDGWDAPLRATSDFPDGGLDLRVELDWEAMLAEARVKVLARRVAELETENQRLAALLVEAENYITELKHVEQEYIGFQRETARLAAERRSAAAPAVTAPTLAEIEARNAYDVRRMVDEASRQLPLAAPTEAQISRACWAWRNDKRRETDGADDLYFRQNWRSLAGLRAYIEREIALPAAEQDEVWSRALRGGDGRPR